MLTIRDDYGKMLANSTGILGTYLGRNPHLKALVIGLSGGIDSGLTAALAQVAVESISGVRVIGRVLPIETNTPDENSRGMHVGEAFCDHFEKRDLTPAYLDLYGQLVTDPDRAKSTSRAEKIRRGNLKARIRMAYLFDLAHAESGMVLSTDNLTELFLGFWTLHGDVGNYGLLQNLWKTEVYGLANHLVANYGAAGETEKQQALARCVEAVPTDGLGITGSDFEQIGVADYQTADGVLLDFLNGNTDLADHPVIVRHRQTAFKRLDPQSIPRDDLFK
jgi:NAD+ synthase